MGTAQEKQDTLGSENREGKALEQYCQNRDEPEAKPSAGGQGFLCLMSIAAQGAHDKSRAVYSGCTAQTLTVGLHSTFLK